MLISLSESTKKLRERSKAEKRKIETTIKKTKLEDITSVLSCNGDIAPKLCTILMGKSLNQQFVHIWEDDDTPVSWNGRVVSYRMKSAEYDVSYWPVDGEEMDGGETYHLKVHQLAADMYCGDLTFI